MVNPGGSDAIGRGEGEGERGDLEAFLDGFREFAVRYGEQAASLSPDADSRVVIGHYAEVVQQQIGLLSGRILSGYRKASEPLQRDVDDYLTLASARPLVAGALDSVGSMKSIFGLSSIGRIIEILKKIIDVIAEILHISLPVDIEKLKDLIDEIWRMIIAIFSPAGAQLIHEDQIKYLEVQYHLVRLAQLRENGRGLTGESDTG